MPPDIRCYIAAANAREGKGKGKEKVFFLGVWKGKKEEEGRRKEEGGLLFTES